MRVLLLEQSECFLGTELSHAGEVLDPKAIQYLGSLQFACATAQRTFDISVGDRMAAALSDNTSSLDASQLRGSRGFLHLPAWWLLRIGNRDRYAVDQNHSDGDPAIRHVQLCPALGEPDQTLVGNTVELGERPQVFDYLTCDPQGLLRDVNLGWSHRCFRLPIRRPGSAELTETNFPCPSRVVWNSFLSNLFLPPTK